MPPWLISARSKKIITLADYIPKLYPRVTLPQRVSSFQPVASLPNHEHRTMSIEP